MPGVSVIRPRFEGISEPSRGDISEIVGDFQNMLDNREDSRSFANSVLASDGTLHLPFSTNS